MADTIKRDKSGMWTEMPPSAKNRKPDIRQPIPAPVPENNNSNSKAGKRAIRKSGQKAVKQAKKKRIQENSLRLITGRSGRITKQPVLIGKTARCRAF